jgi:hypothetical protein
MNARPGSVRRLSSFRADSQPKPPRCCASRHGRRRAVTRPLPSRARNCATTSPVRSSSSRYRPWNCAQRAGSWPNHLRNSSLGAMSFSQSVSAASALRSPRGRRPWDLVTRSCQAHSPLRITGTRLPSLPSPSMSILSEPIIQSIWMKLLLPPRAAISSWLSEAPSTKHFE